MAHAFDHHNASLSEGFFLRCCGRGLTWKALLVTGWHGFPRRRRQPWRRGARRAPPPPCAAPGGGGSRGSDPIIFGAGAPPGRGKWATLKATIYPPLKGSLPPQRSLAGRPSSRPGSRGRRIEHRRCAAHTRLQLRQQQPERGASRNRYRHVTLQRQHSAAGRPPNAECSHYPAFPPSGMDAKETALIATQSSYRLASNREVRQWQASRSVISTTT